MTSTPRIFTTEQESTLENLNFNIHDLYPPQCCMALQFYITVFSVKVLLIGILVHLISLLNVNEELCIGFVLLNHY
jgi:hypothetical protein